LCESKTDFPNTTPLPLDRTNTTPLPLDHTNTTPLPGAYTNTFPIPTPVLPEVNEYKFQNVTPVSSSVESRHLVQPPEKCIESQPKPAKYVDEVTMTATLTVPTEGEIRKKSYTESVHSFEVIFDTSEAWKEVEEYEADDYVNELYPKHQKSTSFWEFFFTDTDLEWEYSTKSEFKTFTKLSIPTSLLKITKFPHNFTHTTGYKMINDSEIVRPTPVLVAPIPAILGAAKLINTYSNIVFWTRTVLDSLILCIFNILNMYLFEYIKGQELETKLLQVEYRYFVFDRGKNLDSMQRLSDLKMS